MNNTKKYRRELHKIPELGYLEFKTQQYLMDIITSLGFEPKKLTTTGVSVYIDLNKEETIAFRSDIDALKITEETNVDFQSTHEGYMHACGHDGHMAILLGFLTHLSTTDLTSLNKNILCIFQPAEESPGGARNIVKSGIFEQTNTKAIYGLHVFPEFEEGLIVTKPGAQMASASEITMHFKGKSAHIAMPKDGADAILASSYFNIELNKRVKSKITNEQYNLGFGKMTGGTIRNIVSEYATLEGTIRTLSKKSFQLIKDTIDELVIEIDKLYRVKATYQLSPHPYPAVINDTDLYNRLESLQLDQFHKLAQPFMIAEDFSYYQEHIPGIFVFLGSKNKSLGYVNPLHSNKFNFNEDILDIGVHLYTKIIESY